MAKESTQHKLDRVRKPRVQITYDVEVNGAMQLKELPFLVGVMGDFSGKQEKPLPPLKDRKFIQIDRDNFDQVLAGMNPRVAYRVDDKLTGTEGKQLNVELKFKSMDDFSPENVARQIDPLAKLLETRGKLTDLLNRMDGNDKLEEMLENVLKNTEARTQLTKSLGVEGATPEGETAGEKESQ
jgi:type VI secretion system protein ImpB